MKTLTTFISSWSHKKTIGLLLLLSFLSCTNEDFCDGCMNENQIPIEEEPEQPPIEEDTIYFPPIANAGVDQIIILPQTSTMLDGNASTDSIGISTFFWKKIEGPEFFNIVSPDSAQSTVKYMVLGTYSFELTVTNTAGLSAKDTTKITIQYPDSPPSNCDNSDRLQVFAQLTPLGSLSKPRVDVTVASVDTKILFAGGMSRVANDCPECWGSSRVDIYDTATQQWTMAELSEGRHGIAAASVDNKIYFAGGANGDGAFDTLFSTVDIYDTTTDNWSVINLSQPRAYMAAAGVGNKVIFAGGEKDMDYQTSNIIDIYDMTTSTWSTAYLSEARAYISAVAINGKAYFAGGQKEDRWYADPSSSIDIYDNNSGIWSSSYLSQPMGNPVGIANDQKIYWASGCTVEIKNITDWSSNIANLSESGSVSHAVKKDNKIIFLRPSYGGTNKFDLYDIATDTWSIGILPQTVYNAAMITANNETYLVAQPSQTEANKLWKLDL